MATQFIKGHDNVHFIMDEYAKPIKNSEGKYEIDPSDNNKVKHKGNIYSIEAYFPKKEGNNPKEFFMVQLHVSDIKEIYKKIIEAEKRECFDYPDY